ncbi:MAG: nicotinate-nucleotide--dimethylbenzimidazole phosphoribosyltransferase [Oscillospiraceae bacterium]|nr:nicotinate-nucleotide--dimethylbenzimidazole phosphoribosyltransferase [Oscillospiraceae bacterium]
MHDEELTRLEQALSDLVASLPEPDGGAMEAARRRQDALAKPPGSLGRLEELSVQLAGITGQAVSEIEQTHILVFAADNGVVAEGVASAPKSVTLRQTVNIAHYRTGAGVLAKQFGSAITVCDVGVDAEIGDPAVLDRKLMRGTDNIARGQAMTRKTALRAILTGAELAENTAADALGVGEMGIGNTTTSSAVLSALLGADPETVTGRGGGLTDAGLRRKLDTVRQALNANRPDPADVVDVISKVGGLDIAAMCGAFLGAAKSRRPAVIDGFISVVAALCAARLCPRMLHYLIPSHASAEPGYALAINALGLRPMLLLDMRLGEGSGCPLAFQVLRASCAVMRDMVSFSNAGIDDGYLEEIRTAPSPTAYPISISSSFSLPSEGEGEREG